MSAIALPLGQATTWLSLGQAARRLGVSRTVVRRLIAERKLTVRTVGYWPRVLEAEVSALAEAATTPAMSIE